MRLRLLLAIPPALLFALHGHIWHVAAHGHVPWTLVAHPVCLAALLPKIPFAIAAYAAARLLLDAVVAIVERRGLTVAERRRPPLSARRGSTVPPSRLLLSARRLTRGPPRVLAA